MLHEREKLEWFSIAGVRFNTHGSDDVQIESLGIRYGYDEITIIPSRYFPLGMHPW